jgi:hypothetical protein
MTEPRKTERRQPVMNEVFLLLFLALAQIGRQSPGVMAVQA